MGPALNKLRFRKIRVVSVYVGNLLFNTLAQSGPGCEWKDWGYERKCNGIET
jgi:hypothetical protein